MKINTTKEEFVKICYPLACNIRNKYNIARIISLSQSAHESNFGNSDLAIQAKNLFGIKSTENWIKKGGKVWLGKTWENIQGKDVKLVAGFRMYDSWKESFEDWAELISNLGRYKEAYKLAQVGLVRQYGEEVQRAGYCTDMRYGEKLEKVSEVIKELCKKLGYEI